MSSTKAVPSIVTSHQDDVSNSVETGHSKCSDMKSSESKTDEEPLKSVNTSTENGDVSNKAEECEGGENSTLKCPEPKGEKQVKSTGELADGELKQRRKSKLSLNSESRNKSKFKEDISQASIISFFQKMSPKASESRKELNNSEEKKCEQNVEVNGSCNLTKEKRNSSNLNCETVLNENDVENGKVISLKSNKEKLLKDGEQEAGRADQNFASTELETTVQANGSRKSEKASDESVENDQSFHLTNLVDVNKKSSSDMKISEDDANLSMKVDGKLVKLDKKRNKDSKKSENADKEQKLSSSKVAKDKSKSKLGRKSVTEVDSQEQNSIPPTKTKKTEETKTNSAHKKNKNASKSSKDKTKTDKVTKVDNDIAESKETNGNSDTKENKKVRFSEEIKEFSPKSVRKNHSLADAESSTQQKLNTNENSNDNEEESSKTEIKNAFAFMMNSRYKSIGQNSPGKEAEPSDEPSEVVAQKKNKLASRKAIFQEWADVKGAKKRKFEDEEKGIVIERKLKKRAKRLKKMLTEEPNLDDGSVKKRRSKVLKIIESDSEDAPDSDTGTHKEQKISKSSAKNLPATSKHKVKKSSEKASKSDSAEAEIFVKKSESHLDSSSSNCCVNEIDGSDVNSNLKENTAKSSPSTPWQQTALSNFFEIIACKKPDAMKSKLQLKSDSPIKRTKENKIKSKRSVKKITVEDLSQSSVEVINDDFVSPKERTKENKIKSKRSVKKITVEDLSQSSVEVIDDFVSPKENGELQMAVTPNTVTKWKMRLKVKLAEQDDESIEKLIHANLELKQEVVKSKKKPKVSESSDSDANLELKQEVVKSKKKPKVLESSNSDSDEPLASKSYRKGKETSSRRSDKMQPVKLAPLFIKAKPKPKVDKATVEARRKFLHSSLPESLKKVIEKQQRLEEIEYEVFPSISHVTVKPTPEQLTSCTTNFWSLPAVDLKLKKLESYHPTIALLGVGSVTNSNIPDASKPPLQCMPKITRFKRILKTIKAENPDYPVYKAFRFLHEKHLKYSTEQNTQEVVVVAEPPAKVKKAKRGRPKKKVQPEDDPVEVLENPQMCEQKSTRQEQLWTDKYKPASSEEILGNHASVTHLKGWLTTWLEFSEEINMQRAKRKRRHSDSSSDFESGSNTDSRDSARLPGNTLILCGPCGSGKTSAVYALCGELGVNVLELNASSKRTGKRLLLELQEATQSHQVRKKDSNSLAPFLKRDESSASSQSSNSQGSDSQTSTSNKKMCLILIEDVDIVFEQDESFLSALGQLLAMSKRPIVLTTADTNCLHLKKLFQQYPVVDFVPLTSKILATWLQILCLVEGLHVDRRAIAELLEFNGGDVRCTLLQLQFWAQSGGQPKLADVLPVRNPSTVVGNSDGSLCKDDSCNIPWLNEDETEQDGDLIATHSNCLQYFRAVDDRNGLYTAIPLDLGNVWWNLPGTLRLPLPLESKRVKMEILKTEGSALIDKKLEYENLKNVVDIFETLAMTDVLYEKLAIDCDLEPVHRNTNNRVKNSLDLSESMETWSTSKDISCEWSHTMLNGYVDIYNCGSSGSSSFNYSAVDEKRWRTKNNKCKDALLEAVPVLCHVDHRPVNLDYFSALRTMARSELVRASSNNKRKNRFYNYLRGLGITCSDSFFKTVCDVFCHEL